MLRLTRKAQSTAEYAIVIGLVIAAAVAMQVYVKRGIQAKIKGVVDFKDISKGTDSVTFSGDQFEPDYSTSNMNNTRTEALEIVTKTGGEVVRDNTKGGGEISSRTGTQTTAAKQN